MTPKFFELYQSRHDENKSDAEFEDIYKEEA